MRFVYFLLIAAIATAISNDPQLQIETVKGLVGRVLGDVHYAIIHFNIIRNMLTSSISKL